MINTRNVRLIVGVLALLGIFAFFASSQHSLTHHTAASQLSKPASNPPPIQNPPEQQQKQQQQDDEEHDDSKNTLQGTSHQGTKPPYEIDSTPKNNKINAEKLDSSKSNAEIANPKEGEKEDTQMSTPEKSLLLTKNVIKLNMLL